jgi:hypothetical protein
MAIFQLAITEEDAAMIASSLRTAAAKLRHNAPDPWYVGSAQSRAYCTAMGEAVRRDKLASTIEELAQAHDRA